MVAEKWAATTFPYHLHHPQSHCKNIQSNLEYYTCYANTALKQVPKQVSPPLEEAESQEYLAEMLRDVALWH